MNAEAQPKTEDVPPQFPQLQSNDGNLTFHLTLDKSVNKALEKFVSIIVVNSAVVGMFCILAVWMIFAWSHAATEARLKQQQLMSMEALLLREGVLQPGDIQRGPEGNVQYIRKEKK